MIQYARPSFWRVAMKDPITWLAIAVDLVPISFVVMFGWGATELVLLYWAENIVIGIATFVRILLSGFVKLGPIGGFGTMFMAAFFVFHYGMFCFGHGVFVMDFAEGMIVDNGPPGFETIKSMFLQAANYAPGMMFVLGLIGLFQLVALVKDYWPGGQAELPDPMTEMFSPYGRIVVLHVAVIGGAFLMIALGNPMLGVFILIALRAVFSLIGRSWRDRGPVGEKPEEKKQIFEDRF
tara:strand:- start:40546 stop:41256 length:711 start_codon:yes stop_codon:yes gene_type:complete